MKSSLSPNCLSSLSPSSSPLRPPPPPPPQLPNRRPAASPKLPPSSSGAGGIQVRPGAGTSPLRVLEIALHRARVGQEVPALKLIGGNVGIDVVRQPSLVIEGDFHDQQFPFPNSTCNFEFPSVLDHALYPLKFIGEIELTLKLGGISVLHVTLKHRVDKYSANHPYTVIASFAWLLFYLMMAETKGGRLARDRGSGEASLFSPHGCLSRVAGPSHLADLATSTWCVYQTTLQASALLSLASSSRRAPT
ncbi:hypothetical protein NL676_013917 [Syzygium grande]|nr:hypothetical protein NL676_013917 [Syzygium grande]